MVRFNIRLLDISHGSLCATSDGSVIRTLKWNFIAVTYDYSDEVMKWTSHLMSVDLNNKELGKKELVGHTSW